jgi:hypothetical protein
MVAILINLFKLLIPEPILASYISLHRVVLFASLLTLFFAAIFAAILRRFFILGPFLRLFCGDFGAQIWK